MIEIGAAISSKALSDSVGRETSNTEPDLRLYSSRVVPTAKIFAEIAVLFDACSLPRRSQELAFIASFMMCNNIVTSICYK